jgi:hypothetical protein
MVQGNCRAGIVEGWETRQLRRGDPTPRFRDAKVGSHLPIAAARATSAAMSITALGDYDK